jgi:hypothetical protein
MYFAPNRRGLPVPRNQVDVHEHDEGLIHTEGHLDEAVEAVRNSLPVAQYMDSDADSAVGHLVSTRMPYHHSIDIIPGEPGWRNEHAGYSSKLIENSHKDSFDVTSQTARWQAFGDDTQSNNFREAMGDLRHRVRGVLLDPSSERARQIMQHALANPVRNPRDRGINPEKYSPQFLKVIKGSENFLEEFDEDVIDLKTGTWAKIHPDEYFPTRG